MAKILFKEQTASNEIIKQKDSTINGLMKDMNLIQKWLTGFCDGKMLDLQTICNDCTNICIRNSIGSVLKEANGSSVYTTNSNYYNQFKFLDHSNVLHKNMKDMEVQLQESKDYCKKADSRLERVVEYYAKKEQNKKDKEQYLENYNRELNDEVNAFRNQVTELDLKYVTRLNESVKTTNETIVS